MKVELTLVGKEALTEDIKSVVYELDSDDINTPYTHAVTNAVFDKIKDDSGVFVIFLEEENKYFDFLVSSDWLFIEPHLENLAYLDFDIKLNVFEFNNYQEAFKYCYDIKSK